MNRQTVFSLAMIAWLVLWGVLEHWQRQRRRKRDKYAAYNEGYER